MEIQPTRLSLFYRWLAKKARLSMPQAFLKDLRQPGETFYDLPGDRWMPVNPSPDYIERRIAAETARREYGRRLARAVSVNVLMFGVLVYLFAGGVTLTGLEIKEKWETYQAEKRAEEQRQIAEEKAARLEAERQAQKQAQIAAAKERSVEFVGKLREFYAKLPQVALNHRLISIALLAKSEKDELAGAKIRAIQGAEGVKTAVNNVHLLKKIESLAAAAEQIDEKTAKRLDGELDDLAAQENKLKNYLDSLAQYDSASIVEAYKQRSEQLDQAAANVTFSKSALFEWEAWGRAIAKKEKGGTQ